MLKFLNVIIFSILLFSAFGCSSIKSINDKLANLYGLTQEQYDFVKEETVPDGKLDFEKQFEENKLIIINNVAYNKKAAGLYTWASEMKKLGVTNANEAIALYESLSDTELRESQKNAMKNAYAK